MTWSGRDSQVGEPLSATSGYRQGSVSGAQIRGLERAPRRGPWRGLVFLTLLMVIIVVGGVVFAGPKLRDVAYDLAASNPQVMRMPLVPDVVRERLGDRLSQPAGDRAIPVRFTVEAGQGVREIARNLQRQGLLLEPLAFTYLAVTEGVDGQLHTGSFNLDPTMTPQQILDRLQSPPDPDTVKVPLGIRSGLRIEQITALIQTRKLGFSAEEFYQLATHPPAWVREEFPWLKVLPEGRSLEGFLGADSNLAIDSDLSAEGFLRILLSDWEKDVGPEVIKEVQDKGLDFYEVLTLASIVEKETAVDRERRLVAGVYSNRLQFGGETAGFLQVDPTLSYAVDTDRLTRLRRFWVEPPQGGCPSSTVHYKWNQTLVVSGVGMQTVDISENDPIFDSYGSQSFGTVKASASGDASIQAFFTSLACEGEWHFVARGNASGWGADTVLTLVGNAVETNAWLTATPDSASALFGTIQFNGSGFGANEHVSCWLRTPRGQVLGYPHDEFLTYNIDPPPVGISLKNLAIRSDSAGNIAFDFVSGSQYIDIDFNLVLGGTSFPDHLTIKDPVQSEGALGVYAMTCRGDSSGATAIAEFTLTGGFVDP